MVIPGSIEGIYKMRFHWKSPGICRGGLNFYGDIKNTQHLEAFVKKDRRTRESAEELLCGDHRVSIFFEPNPDSQPIPNAELYERFCKSVTQTKWHVVPQAEAKDVNGPYLAEKRNSRWDGFFVELRSEGRPGSFTSNEIQELVTLCSEISSEGARTIEKQHLELKTSKFC